MCLCHAARKTQGRRTRDLARGTSIGQGPGMSPTVTLYRWAVFLLAAFYCLYELAFGPWGGFGGPFRYLTIWALFLSFFCASRMMALMEHRSARRWDALVSAVAVVNAMVVLLYWRLYFADPTSVTRDGQLSQPWLEFYLHGLGPLLQWIDATFIHRAFRRLGQALAVLVGIVVAYLVWEEVAVGPLNDSPSGTVTSGLPYPFLNDLTFDDRMTFYVTNVAVSVLLLGVFAGIAWIVRRSLPAPAAP